MAGIDVNEVKIEGNLDYTPKISGIKVDSTNTAHSTYKKNGGFLHLSARLQNVIIKNVMVVGSSVAGGNGGFIYSENT